MATVEIETHGCKLNTADSQQMAAEFLRAGFEVRSRENSNPPDVFILNSCTVTHVADKKARPSDLCREAQISERVDGNDRLLPGTGR